MYSNDERNEVIQYLDQTRGGLIDAVASLTENQANFKPAPDAWSVAGIVEHLAIVEDRVIARISQMLESVPSSSNSGIESNDADLFGKVADRSQKVQAPAPIHPTGQPLASSLERLTVTRGVLDGLIQSVPSDFRRRSMPHPVLGPLDGHQWLVTLAGHCSRHTQQILETKSAPQFPDR